MSRIGKKSIKIPEGVKVTISNYEINVSGPKGELVFKFNKKIDVQMKENEIVVDNKSKDKFYRSLHGTTRTLIDNMIKGVTDGFEKELEITGVGFKAIKKGNDLDMSLGFSHPVVIKAPDGIQFDVNANKLKISGIDKEKVGNMAAYIRNLKKVEPYKGKGIKYVGEVVRKKAGKAGKVAAAPGASGASGGGEK